MIDVLPAAPGCRSLREVPGKRSEYKRGGRIMQMVPSRREALKGAAMLAAMSVARSAIAQTKFFRIGVNCEAAIRSTSALGG
jgi:hypothetical protein